MTFYRGVSTNDQIYGGGQFVRDHGYGHEMFNFMPYGKHVYGYARPTKGNGAFMDGAGIKLEKLGAKKTDSELTGATVIFVASPPPPQRGTYIIGWYTNATIYRTCQKLADGSKRIHQGEQIGYYATTNVKDAVRLEPIDRQFPIPSHQKGYIGQSNVWYADGPNLKAEFRQSVIHYLQTRQLPSVKRSQAKGTARQPDPLLRCKVEEAARQETIRYFEKKGYIIDPRDKDNLGWDLFANYGSRQLRLEVKGLSGSGTCVELTPNEYAMMQKYRSSYYICVVTNALVRPTLAVFGFVPDVENWQDEKGRTLSIEPQTGARCRAM